MFGRRRKAERLLAARAREERHAGEPRERRNAARDPERAARSECRHEDAAARECSQLGGGAEAVERRERAAVTVGLDALVDQGPEAGVLEAVAEPADEPPPDHEPEHCPERRDELFEGPERIR